VKYLLVSIKASSGVPHQKTRAATARRSFLMDGAREEADFIGLIMSRLGLELQGDVTGGCD